MWAVWLKQRKSILVWYTITILYCMRLGIWWIIWRTFIVLLLRACQGDIFVKNYGQERRLNAYLRQRCRKCYKTIYWTIGKLWSVLHHHYHVSLVAVTIIVTIRCKRVIILHIYPWPLSLWHISSKFLQQYFSFGLWQPFRLWQVYIVRAVI